MIRAIIFDLDNTLLDFVKMKQFAVKAAITAMIEAGLDVDEEKAYKDIFDLYVEKGWENQQVFDDYLNQTVGKVSNKIFGEEIMKLDKGGFKKLEDFALSSGKQYVKEGMGNLRDRMAGKTDRDTGKGARKALADIVRDRKSGIGSSATAKSSMEKRAATAAAVNANSQAVNKYFDRIKAREELAKAASDITSFDITRKRDLRATRSKGLTAMAGFEMDELGMDEIKSLSRKPLNY